MNCRFCSKQDIIRFLDLGTMALANSFLSEAEFQAGMSRSIPLMSISAMSAVSCRSVT